MQTQTLEVNDLCQGFEQLYAELNELWAALVSLQLSVMDPGWKGAMDPLLPC